MTIQEQAQQIPDLKAAAGLVAAGAGGSLAQALTEWANIFVACGNAILVLGGCYLMYNRIFDKRRTRRASDTED